MSASPISFYPSQSTLRFEALLATPGWEHESRYKSQAQDLISQEWPSLECRLTNSGTAALELGTLLENFNVGDEIILPSYTYVSSATAFLLRGCTLKFADINPSTLCLDPKSVEPLITSKTKGVLTVHYNGINPEIKKLRELCNHYSIKLWGDGAMALGQGQDLFNCCDWSIISLDHTKHFHAIQGGLFLSHPERYENLDSCLRNGTNKLDFDRGIIDSYEWVCQGSKFEMSELHAYVLVQQWKHKTERVNQRQSNSLYLHNALLAGEEKGYWKCPKYAESAFHGYYLIFPNAAIRKQVQHQLNAQGIQARPHYTPLHSSAFGKQISNLNLPNTDWVANGLLRLPQHEELSLSQLNYTAESLYACFS